MKDEVTRVEQVRYLEGASGHAVLSTAFLLLAGALVSLDRPGLGVVLLVTAFGVSLNGLSIYAWDELRAVFESRFERDDTPSRTLQPHSVSAEMKAELASGFVIVGSFVVGLTALFFVVRTSTFRDAGYLFGAVLLAGNIGAFAWAVIGEG